MRIVEVAGAELESARLLALSQFLLSRAKDTNARKIYSYPTFKNLAANLGINFTKSVLRDMIQKPPLNGLIQDVTGDDADENSGEVIFRGAPTDSETMTVDQARATVDKMAKRAAKKDL